MTFIQKLKLQIKKSNSLVCVGLDSDFDQIPRKFKKYKYPQYKFNQYIINETNQYVSAYKPNSAFYESRGEQGIRELKPTCQFLQKNYPQIPIILDAKRGDIGNTNSAYKKYIFQYLKVDAVTLNPYLGIASLQTFLDEKDKGIIILTKTSNPESSEIQDLEINKKPIWQIITENIIKKYNQNQNCLLVIGATYPAQLKQIRQFAPNMFFLIPGIGSQNGDLDETLQFGLDQNKSGLIINSSRSIIFSNNPQKAIINLKTQINKYTMLSQETKVTRDLI